MHDSNCGDGVKMASAIFLGLLYPHQENVMEFGYLENCITEYFDHARLAIIAKGNKIEGIEAKQ